MKTLITATDKELTLEFNRRIALRRAQENVEGFQRSINDITAQRDRWQAQVDELMAAAPKDEVAPEVHDIHWARKQVLAGKAVRHIENDVQQGGAVYGNVPQGLGRYSTIHNEGLDNDKFTWELVP